MNVETNELKSVFAEDPSVFSTFEVGVQFTGVVAGSIPGDPFPILEMVQRKLMKQGGVSRELIDKKEVESRAKLFLTEIGKDVSDMEPGDITDLAARTVAATTNVFRRDDKGIYIPSHSFKAAMRECINILYAKERWGVAGKGPMNYFVERVFIRPDRIHLMRNGEYLTEADDIAILRGVVRNRLGDQSIVTQHEWVEKPNCSFTIQVLNYEASVGKAEASALSAAEKKSGEKAEGKPGKSAEQELENRWPAIFQLMEQNGISSHRKQSGYGVFVTTRFEKVSGKGKTASKKLAAAS